MKEEELEKEWSEIQIRYDDGTYVRICKEDLKKIEAIDDVIDALKKAKDISSNISTLLR